MLKKAIYILVGILVLTACTEDLSDFESRAKELKEANAKEQERIEEEKKRQEEEKQKNDSLKARLDSLINAGQGSADSLDHPFPQVKTNLPIMEIRTNGRTSIELEYIDAHMKLREMTEDGNTASAIEADLQIKGRGNTTWSFPKKPYRLKFTEKISLLGEHKDKSWVLLANYADKSMLRNRLAFIMSDMSNLEWTPSSHFVEVILNGEYIGTYQLVEKIKVSKHRVNVGDDGFLLEIDQRAPSSGDIYFTINHLEQPVKLREPDVAEGDANYNYVKSFIAKADEMLFSGNFTDPENGWQKYIDMDSFVDWYLINELARNNDAVFFSSCYMNLQRGGKLKMGPVWDFDLAFGNINYNNSYETYGFWIKRVAWYTRLFQDPAFTTRVKERFDYFYEHRNDIMRIISNEAYSLKIAAQNNDEKWHTLYNYTWPNYDIWGCYSNEVQNMKEWLIERFEWLKLQIDLL